MKRLSILVAVLLTTTTPVLANPAEVDLELFEGVLGTQGLNKYDDFCCGHSLKSDQFVKRSNRGVKRCDIESVQDEIVIDDFYRVKRDSIVHFWSHKAVEQAPILNRNYVVIRYKADGELKNLVFNAMHETWGGVFWNQLNLWMSSN